MASYRPREEAFAIIEKIKSDWLQDPHAIFDNQVTDQHCILFLRECLSWYENRVAHTISVDEGSEPTIPVRNQRNDNPTCLTQTNIATQPQPSTLNHHGSSSRVPPPRATTETRRAHVRVTNTTSRRSLSSKKIAPYPAPTARKTRRPPHQRQEAIPISNRHDQSPEIRTPIVYPFTPEFIDGIESEARKVAEILKQVSFSQEMNERAPDVTLVATGNSNAGSLIAKMAQNKDLKSITDVMTYYQEAIIQGEKISGIVRIRTALWKLMYIDSYNFLQLYVSPNSFLTETRKIPGTPWKTLRTELEKKYLQARGLNTPNTYRVFTSRCEKLKRLRDIGLKYVVFCPTLVSQLEHSSLDNWEKCKNELLKARVFSRLDNLVDGFCADWYDILKKIYTRWEVGSSEQGLLRILRGTTNRDER